MQGRRLISLYGAKAKGCGRRFYWKDAVPVSEADMDKFFNMKFEGPHVLKEGSAADGLGPTRLTLQIVEKDVIKQKKKKTRKEKREQRAKQVRSQYRGKRYFSRGGA